MCVFYCTLDNNGSDSNNDDNDDPSGGQSQEEEDDDDSDIDKNDDSKKDKSSTSHKASGASFGLGSRFRNSRWARLGSAKGRSYANNKSKISLLQHNNTEIDTLSKVIHPNDLSPVEIMYGVQKYEDLSNQSFMDNFGNMVIQSILLSNIYYLQSDLKVWYKK